MAAYLDLFRVDIVAAVENVVHQAPDLQLKSTSGWKDNPRGSSMAAVKQYERLAAAYLELHVAGAGRQQAPELESLALL